MFDFVFLLALVVTLLAMRVVTRTVGSMDVTMTVSFVMVSRRVCVDRNSRVFLVER